MADRNNENNDVSSTTRNHIPAFASSEKPSRKKFVLSCAILASMTSLLAGYDTEAMTMPSGALKFMNDPRIDDTTNFVIYCFVIYFPIIGSAIAAGTTSDWIGRRYMILLATVIFFIGSLTKSLASNYASLMVGIFFSGTGVSFALMIAPVYILELSPDSSRGFLTSIPEAMINAGILLSHLSNHFFFKLSHNLSWRLVYGVEVILSVFVGFAVLTLPESPHWLVLKGRLGESKRVLEKTSTTKEEAESRFTEIKADVGIPDNCNEDVISVPIRSSRIGLWRELLLRPSPSLRRVLLAGIGINFFQQATGIHSVLLYSQRIFSNAGINKDSDFLSANVVVSYVKACFILVPIFLVDKIGRRPLLLISVAGIIFSLTGLGFGLMMINHSEKKLIWAVALCVANVLTYVGFYSIGLGPITWVYTSEIFPLRLRGKGASIGVMVNRVTSGVLSMFFISLYKGITIGGMFFLLGGVAIMAWLFFYYFLAETRGKTLKEIEMLFEKFEWRWLRKKNKEEIKVKDGEVMCEPESYPAKVERNFVLRRSLSDTRSIPCFCQTSKRKYFSSF